MASERNPLGGGQRTPRPRALVWDLFGDHLRYVGDGRIPMRALSALLGVFGVGDSTSRVVLARMRRERWFDTYRSGRLSSYALTGRALALLDEGRSRIFGRGTSAWDGLWRMVIYAVPEPDRSQRDQLRKVLGWHGFGPLASATWISPHPRLDVIAEALQERSAGRFDLLESRALDRAVDREMARRCWDLDALAREYAGLLARYEKLPPLTALAALPGDQALRQQVELVTSYRTLPFRDPDLPGELLPEGWPGRRVHEIFIAAHDALHEPADRFVRGIVAQHSP
jgi:phenylacetic acid degradation operon negative regulatory protein